MTTLVPPELEAQAIAWRRHLHANPELSFEEQEFVYETLSAVEGLELERPTATSVAVGKISVPEGPRAAAADTFSIEIQGAGGHAALPHEAVDPIVVAAQAVTNLQQIVSRTVDPIKSAVVSVTRIHAGTADNIIPEAVELGGTARTFDPEVRERVREAIERILRGVTEAHGATYRLGYEQGYAPVINDRDAAALVESAARAELGDDAIEHTPPIMGGEDFSAYLEAAPGAFFVVGAGHKGATPHHHARFTIDETALRSGIAVFVRTALDYLR